MMPFSEITSENSIMGVEKSEKVGKCRKKSEKSLKKSENHQKRHIFSDDFPMFLPHDGNLQHWQCKFISYASDGIFQRWKWKLPTNFDFSDGFFLQCMTVY